MYNRNNESNENNNNHQDVCTTHIPSSQTNILCRIQEDNDSSEDIDLYEHCLVRQLT